MKRLLIDITAEKTFTALTENDKPVEFFVDPREETQRDGSWVGRIIVGRIKTILPGQFAFVDIGAKKNAFINLRKGHGLKAGMSILVQVQKDAIGTKGMYVALDLTIKGRFIVLCANNRGQGVWPVERRRLEEPFPPKAGSLPIPLQGVRGTGSPEVYTLPPTVGISRKIEDEKEIKRLRKIVWKILPNGFSAIVRTNAVGQGEEEIAAEADELRKTFEQIIALSEFARPPATMYPVWGGAAVPQNLLADILSNALDEIHVNTENDEEFVAIKNSICEIIPELAPKISRQPLNLKKQIKTALEKKVPLPCGGFITIEQTEACVVIDVNTGSNVGNTDYKTTVLETNIEAAAVIAAQVRLRNLSGIIICDFIDMPKEHDKTALLEKLAAEIKRDRIKTETAGFVGLGMVLLTRRKTRPPLHEIMQKKCPQCGGDM
ncbi:MAG: ribonuclease E/G [Defluviitaleaceae bacterium]|nr:ribonuclease E/G [Defluviitaleaceae bacterium]